jgi:ice-binding like protein
MSRTPTAPRLARLVVSGALAALLAAACEHDEGPPPAGQLLAIAVTPDPATVPPNGSQQFIAVGTDVTGAVIPVTPVTWSLVASGGAVNSSSGLFTAGVTLATFPSTIRACNSSGNICGFATVIVGNLPAVGFPILGTASTYGILAGASVTCAGPPGTINADVGISPGSTLTGFGPGLCTITGQTRLATPPADTAQLDLTTAYNVLAGLPCNTTIVADLGGTTITPGVYCGSSSVGVTGTLTLNGGGDANARFVIKAGSTLTTGSNASIALTNGTQAKNVYFQVGSSATLGTGTTFRGTIVALTTITLNGTVVMTGRALARNGSVSLAATGNTISLP